MSKKKYVILKGIKEGNKFFTMNLPEPTKLANGTIAYKIIGYANTIKEAQSLLYPTKKDRDNAVRKNLESMGIGNADRLISLINS